MTGWIAVGIAVLATACAPVDLAPPTVGAGTTASVPGFSPAADTFAFPNEIRARHPDRDDLYANYCFVLARGLRQFFAFARFEPAAPRLSAAAYVERVREIAAQPPWLPPPPADDRVAIPGYANLKEFSRAEEAAIKEGLGGRFWTLVHWTNWRVTFPVTRGQQTRVAEEIVRELEAGRLVQLLVTNWPKPELNHTVVAYAFHATVDGIDFDVWDPNDPDGTGMMRFDTGAGQFWATRLYDTEQGVIRAFRMYYSWLL